MVTPWILYSDQLIRASSHCGFGRDYDLVAKIFITIIIFSTSYCTRTYNKVSRGNSKVKESSVKTIYFPFSETTNKSNKLLRLQTLSLLQHFSVFLSDILLYCSNVEYIISLHVYVTYLLHRKKFKHSVSYHVFLYLVFFLKKGAFANNIIPHLSTVSSFATTESH